MISGGPDGVAMLGVALVLAILFAIFLRTRPRTTLVLWCISLCFVPYWMGVNVLVYLPPATAFAILIVASTPMPAWARIRATDVLVAVFVALVVIGHVLGFVDLPSMFVAAVEWASAYLLGRLLAELIELPVLYATFGVVVAIAAGLAVLEFVTAYNPFVHIFPGGPTFEVWGPLQVRGGLLRAEGAFGHSIALGTTCALALPLVLGSNLQPRWKLVCGITLGIGTILTLSRLGIVSSVLGLALCVCFLRSGLGTRAKAAIVVLAAAATVIALPSIVRIFDDAGQEASGSAEYRGSLTSLIPAMQLIGTAGIRSKSAQGVVTWGPFRSIDSALILGGLLYGVLPVALLLIAFVMAVVLVVRGHANPPAIAIVAQLPALVGVALITQYAAAFWFIAGVAVVATAEAARERARSSPAHADVGAGAVSPSTVPGAAGPAAATSHLEEV